MRIFKKTIILLSILCFSILGHSTAKKQFYAYGHMGPKFTISKGYLQEDYPSTLEMGGGMGYKISSLLALELKVNYNRFKNTKDLAKLYPEYYSEPTISRSYLYQTAVMLNAKITPLKRKLSPYLSIGVGGQFEKPAYQLGDEPRLYSTVATYFYATAAIGLNYPITRSWEGFMETGLIYSWSDFRSSLFRHVPIRIGLVYNF